MSINTIVLVVIFVIVVFVKILKDTKMNKKEIILSFSSVIIIGLSYIIYMGVGNDSTKNKENISKTNKVSSKTNEVSSKEDRVHWLVTKHRLNGNTVYATAYVIGDAENCARDVQDVAYSLMKDTYKTASALNLEYGINYNDKYGNKKKKLIGTFRPDVSELRRYKSSFLYQNGDYGRQFGLMGKFKQKGFQ